VPKKRFKDALKTSLNDFRIQISTWEATTKNRPVWRSKIKTGARSEEKSRVVIIASGRRATRITILKSDY
jgi:thioredoxin reductase